MDAAWRAGPVPADAARRPLPMTRRELAERGWDACDVIIISGDAYVDHPSFGAALIGRLLEAAGYRVGILAQPSLARPADFEALGAPRLFWGVTAGNVDSELARLTVMRKRRRDDPYSPDGAPDLRPPHATIAYTAQARRVARGVPVVLGGIEASLRRFPFYDYWTDRVKRAIVFDAKADWLVFGMAERALLALAAALRQGATGAGLPGTARIMRPCDGPADGATGLLLPAFETVADATDAGRDAFNTMTRLIHTHHLSDNPVPLIQAHGDRRLIVQPPAEPLSGAELDYLYALPFTRRPHPAYAGRRIPAFEMIRDSVTIHRGCYGGCAFCAIVAHQGRAVRSRGRAGILAELARLAADPDFRGTVSDLGGPSANMYGTRCRLNRRGCAHRQCLTPDICPNLETDAGPLLALMRAARRAPGIRHLFIGSGLRFDLLQGPQGEVYLDELVRHHVGGRLKIAPEHVSAGVLRRMGKPPPAAYRAFVARFGALARAAGKRHEIVEYFMSGHPGCTLDDMIELALELKRAGVKPESVQDFYPAPLAPATAMYYTGRDPFTNEPVPVARTDREKALQRALLLCQDPAFHARAREALRAAGRPELIGHGRTCLVPPGYEGARAIPRRDGTADEPEREGGWERT